MTKRLSFSFGELGETEIDFFFMGARGDGDRDFLNGS